MTTTLGETDHARRQAPPPPAGDEIDLLAYFEACWRYRYLLLAFVLGVGVITYVINRQLQPTYEVVFRLIVTEPQLDNQPTREVSPVVYRELVESPSQAATLIKEFGLDKPPLNMTPQRFLDDHVVVEVIRDTTIIRVAVRLKDRDLLVRLAQRYAEHVVETAQRLNTEGTDFTADRIRRERDAALERLTLAERSVQDYKRRAQVELLQRDVDTMLQRRPEALDLTVQIQGERARVTQLETALAGQEKVRDTRSALDSLPASRPAERKLRPEESTQRPAGELRTRDGAKPATPERQQRQTEPPPDRQAARNPAEEPLPDLRIRSELVDPFVNPVYEVLERDLADSRARLASFENQRKELVSRLQLDAPSAERLNRLYEAEAGLAALTRDRDVARSAFENAANKYEDARLQSSARSPRLSILDAALPPDRPVAPRSLRNTAAAMMLALTFGIVAVLVLDSERRRASGA